MVTDYDFGDSPPGVPRENGRSVEETVADADTTPRVAMQLRVLATAVETIDATGITVDSIQDITTGTDGVRVDLTVTTPLEALATEPEPAAVEQPTTDDEAESKADVDEEEAECDDQDTDLGKAEDTDDDEELVCDVADCAFTTTSSRGLAIHQGRTHKTDDADDQAAAETEDVDEDGETSAADAVACPDCGKAFDTHPELAGHLNTPQTDCSATTIDEPELPGSITEACVHDLAAEYDTIDAIAADMEVATDRARAILEARGLTTEVTG